LSPQSADQELLDGSVMEVHHQVFYVSLGYMQNNMRSSVTLKLKLTLTLTITDTGGAVLTLMLGYRPGGELPSQTPSLDLWTLP